MVRVKPHFVPPPANIDTPAPEDDILLPGLGFAPANVSTSSLNANELKSIAALVAYVAYTQNVSEETVRAVFNANFNIESVHALHTDHYSDAISFLVDLRLNEVLN